MARLIAWSLSFIVIPLLTMTAVAHQSHPHPNRASASATPEDITLVAEEITLVAIDPAPTAIPGAQLSATVHGEPMGQLQTGTLVMSRWVENGEPAVRELPPELDWPAPLVHSATEMEVIFDTASAPFIVNMSLWTRVDNAGMPRGPPFRIDCELDGDPAVCQIGNRSDQNQVHVRFDLPVEESSQYVAVYAAWVLDPTAPKPAAVDWLLFEAGWLFHVLSKHE